MTAKSFLIAVMCCCFASAAKDTAIGPGDPSTWKQWLENSNRNLGRRLMWFQTDAYKVIFDTEEGPVTFIVNHDTEKNALTLNLFAVDVTNKLLSSDDLPAEDEKVWNDKVWAQSLFESKCLSLVFTSKGIGRVEGVGTFDAAEYGGCGSFYRGKMLMELADYLACKFGQTRMELEDLSHIQCRNKDSVSASMALFYTLKTGRSWYESFCYEYVSKHEDAAQRLQAVGDEDLDWKDPNTAFQNILSAYVIHHDKKAPTVSNRDFILWVWNEHCDKWKDVIEHIYGTPSLERLKKGGPMRKELTCSIGWPGAVCAS